MWLVERLGRFTALVVLAVVAGLTFLFLTLAEAVSWWFLIPAVPFVLLVLPALALVLGMIFAGTSRSGPEGIDRSEAPDLWNAVDAALGDLGTGDVRLHLSDDLNASVGRTRRFAGLGSVLHVTLGLPLLALLDRSGLDAVLAHEAAHVRFKDVNGARNVAEFVDCFDLVFDYVPPGESVVGTVILFGLNDLAHYAQLDFARLSRRAELRADDAAAQQGDARAPARALKLLAAGGAFIEDEIATPLKREMLGSYGVVESPFSRIMRRLNEMRTPAGVEGWFRKAMEKEAREKAQERHAATHPPIRERLLALGVPPDFAIDRLGPPVLAELVPAPLAERLSKRFETEWVEETRPLD